MSIFLLLIPFVSVFLGFWILWRLVSINKPDLPAQARARGVVLPKEFVGPSYRSQHPHFWGDDEP
jgi:hypothetical protein